MTTLIVGATGATGRLLVQQLLERGESVRVIVRSPDSLPEAVREHPNLSVIHRPVLELSDAELEQHVSGCDAIASCLGHTLSFKGIFGKPRRLVLDATRRLCSAVIATQPSTAVKFVLMNTTGNRNRDLDEPVSFGQKVVLALLRVLVPPHADNEAAADYLRTQNPSQQGPIEWAAVRPDGLVDQDQVTPFDVHPSPTRSAIFDAGKTSRINVACLMADLITDGTTWAQWRGQMPVIYNR